jgi:maltose O-acetyltransferase
MRVRAQRQWFFIRQRLFAVASFLLPDNMSGGRLRATLLRWNGAALGRRCFVRGDLHIQESFEFTLGDDVFINAGCTLDGAAPIGIGDRVQLGYQVALITGDHSIGGPMCRAGDHCARPIQIGEGAWIGARAIVLPGVTIGRGAVVAAGAIVTRDVPPNTLVAGTPARPIRTLDCEAEQVDIALSKAAQAGSDAAD